MNERGSGGAERAREIVGRGAAVAAAAEKWVKPRASRHEDDLVAAT